MSRLHEPRLELIADERRHDDPALRGWQLQSPAPGWFQPRIEVHSWCEAGTAIGTLDVLGRRHLLVVPRGPRGFLAAAAAERSAGLDARAVGYRDLVAAVRAGGLTADAGAAAEAATQASAAAGRVFCAPTSGRFYGKPGPGKPPFVAPGTALVHGATICLLEVMKTFHRVTYSGADLPATARVSRILVAEGDDVNAGQPLLELE